MSRPLLLIYITDISYGAALLDPSMSMSKKIVFQNHGVLFARSKSFTWRTISFFTNSRIIILQGNRIAVKRMDGLVAWILPRSWYVSSNWNSWKDVLRYITVGVPWVRISRLCIHDSVTSKLWLEIVYRNLWVSLLNSSRARILAPSGVIWKTNPIIKVSRTRACLLKGAV